LQAVLYLAEHAVERRVRANEAADALGISRNYLSKIMHQLVRAGVLTSARGKRGGFRLAVPPGELSLLSIVSQFDRIEERRSCLLGRPECSDSSACAAHWRWKAVSEQLAAFFRETTVADLYAVAGGR
jgi:Rrf2 family nitric oxide-sensitive transcriptional repressor